MYYLRYFLLLISLVLYHFVSAQYFQSAFGTGSHVDDSTIESVMDNSGNIYLTGYAYLGTTFGDYQIQNRGIYLAKLNPQGEVMWVFESDGSSDTQATGLALDSESNVYITGIFDHGFSIGPYEFNINLGDRMYLAKFTTDGELLWAKEFGSTNYRGKVFPNGIQIDKDDQVIIAGSFIEDVVFDDYHLESKEGYNYSYHDLFLTKLNQNGDVIWAKRMGGKYDDYCYSLHFDGNENIYLSGTFSPKEADFDSLLIDLENTSTRGYVLKLNTTGESQWIRYHEYGDNSTSESHMVASDSKGAVYSLGTYYNTLILDRDTLDSGDLFLVKYDEAGNQVYSKSINSQVYHYGYVPGYVVRRSGDIKVDHENSLFLSSNFKQVLYFEQDTLVSQGGGTPKADIFIAKYNETGYHQWSVQTTGYSHDYSNSIDILGDTILISGRYASLTMNLGDFELMNNSGNDDDDLFVGVLRDTTDIICGESQFSITSTQNFVCDQDSLLLNIVEINSNYIEWFKDHLLVHNGFEASIYVKESGFYYAIINSGSPCVDTTESVWIDKKEKPNIQILPEGELILCQGDNIILHTPNEEENDLSWFYNFTHNISSSDSIDVNKGGHYLLKTDNNFCINTDTVFIESGKPIIDMELEPDSVSCPGKTITVSSFNDISYHYSWTLNGEILSNHLNYLELNDSGWVTLDVSYKECSVKDSVYIQQNVQPQLDSFLESLVVDVLPVQLSVDSGNYNCFWSQHTNGQVISDSYHVEIHEDGYYSLYAYNLCGNVYFPFQIISIPNNLIYPNPTKGCFRILALGDNETKLKLHIFDSKGKNIMESLEVLNNELICTHHLKSGTYYIVVESNQATYTEKLIIYN